MYDPTVRPRVLVADDNANVRRIICLFLQNANYQTLEARNGREAIDTAKAARPDLIFLDVMMPLLDGFQICRALKEDPDTREIPVIICTAKTLKDDLIAAIRAGAADYVVKPFTREAILEKADRALRAAQVRPTDRLPSVERRGASRRRVSWRVSWAQRNETEARKLPPLFKAPVHDVSLKGFSFGFRRCTECTGSESKTAHSFCLDAPQARRVPDSSPLTFVFSDADLVLFEAEGTIAHFHAEGSSERVGITFTDLASDGRRLIESLTRET